MCGRRTANVEMTGAAIEALNAAGRHRTEAQARALAYLHEAQNRQDGGFATEVGGASNTDSSAWVSQAIWAAGGEPEGAEWTTVSGTDPLSYMESQLQPNGSVNYDSGTEANPVFNTAYVIPALAGRPLPIAAVARAAPASSATVPDGVSAGGGGSGAPLFSRPQPQSEGRARGGVRVLGSTPGTPRSGGRRARNGRGRAWTGRRRACAGRGRNRPSRTSGAGARQGGARSHAGRSGRAAGERPAAGLLSAARREENGAPGLRSAGEGGSATSRARSAS